MEKILWQFLRESNSILDLSTDKIQFIYKSKILNSPLYLKKKAKEIFRLLDHNNLIQVKDPGDIIGGKKNL